MPMSVTGALVPPKPLALRRSYSSSGISNVMSERPDSTSATRAEGSVTNLTITVSKAGLAP